MSDGLPQDDLAKRRRLNLGLCPDHGHKLIVLERCGDQITCDCPDPNCAFSYTNDTESKVVQAVLGRKRHTG